MNPTPTRHQQAMAERRASADAGRAWARDWRERMKPRFDAMEAAGAFAPEAAA